MCRRANVTFITVFKRHNDAVCVCVFVFECRVRREDYKLGSCKLEFSILACICATILPAVNCELAAWCVIVVRLSVVLPFSLAFMNGVAYITSREIKQFIACACVWESDWQCVCERVCLFPLFSPVSYFSVSHNFSYCCGFWITFYWCSTVQCTRISHRI